MNRLKKNLGHAKTIIGPIGKIFAIQYIVSAIVGVVIFAIVIIMIVIFSTRQSNSIDEFDIRRFNNSYEIYKGTEYGSSVGNLIDEVSTNNKKDKKHQIALKYKEIVTK